MSTVNNSSKYTRPVGKSSNTPVKITDNTKTVAPAQGGVDGRLYTPNPSTPASLSVEPIAKDTVAPADRKEKKDIKEKKEKVEVSDDESPLIDHRDVEKTGSWADINDAEDDVRGVGDEPEDKKDVRDDRHDNEDYEDDFSADSSSLAKYYAQPRRAANAAPGRDSFMIERFAETNVFWLHVEQWWIKYAAGRIVAIFNTNLVKPKDVDDLIKRFVREWELVAHISDERDIARLKRRPLCVHANAGLVFDDAGIMRVTAPVEEAKRDFLVTKIVFDRSDGGDTHLKPIKAKEERDVRRDNGRGERDYIKRDNRNGQELNRSTRSDRRDDSVGSASLPRRSDQPRQSGGVSASVRGGRPMKR